MKIVMSFIMLIVSVLGFAISAFDNILWGYVRDEASYLLPEPDVLGNMQWIALFLSLAFVVISVVMLIFAFGRRKMHFPVVGILFAVCVMTFIFSVIITGLSVKTQIDLGVPIAMS